MSEIKHQQELYKWFYNKYPQYRIETECKDVKQPRCLLYHNYNNPKSAVVGASGIGITKGLPDLFLAVPVRQPMRSLGFYCGLYLELKGKGKKPTKAQHEVIDKLWAAGYAATWSDNLEMSKAIIAGYLDGEFFC